MKTVARWTLTPVTARCVHTLSDGDTGRETAPALILIITTVTVHIILVARVTFTSEALLRVNAAAIFADSIPK